MRKLFLIIFLSFSCYFSFGQDIVNDSTMFYGMVLKDNVNLKNTPKSYSYSNNYLNKGEAVFIYSYEKAGYSEGYYGVFKDTLSGFLAEGEINLPIEFEDYLKSTSGDENLRMNFAERNARLYLLNKIEKEIALYEKYKKVGLVITNKKFSFAEYGGQFGLELTFYNGYKKDIKYIELTVRPYNRVGDKVFDDFRRDVSRARIIGPFKSDSVSSVEFDDLFWDDRDVISYLVITYMKVTFMDGTVKEIKDINKHLAEGIYNGKGE